MGSACADPVFLSCAFAALRSVLPASGTAPTLGRPIGAIESAETCGPVPDTPPGLFLVCVVRLSRDRLTRRDLLTVGQQGMFTSNLSRRTVQLPSIGRAFARRSSHGDWACYDSSHCAESKPARPCSRGRFDISARAIGPAERSPNEQVQEILAMVAEGAQKRTNRASATDRPESTGSRTVDTQATLPSTNSSNRNDGR